MTDKLSRRWRTFALLAAFFCAAQPPPAGAEEISLQVVIEAGERVGGEETIRLTQGDRLALSVVSDTPVHLHLHGYDREVAAAPGAPGVLEVDARFSGRFPVEAHGDGGGRVLFYLEVYPN